MSSEYAEIATNSETSLTVRLPIQLSFETSGSGDALISASLSKHEALARAAREKCHEAQIAGNASLGGLRVAAEELSSKCDRLRRELAEIEQAVAMQNDCIVVVRPLSVVAEKGTPLTDHGKSSRRRDHSTDE